MEMTTYQAVFAVLLIFFVGGGLYFFVLPRYLEKK